MKNRSNKFAQIIKFNIFLENWTSFLLKISCTRACTRICNCIEPLVVQNALITIKNFKQWSFELLFCIKVYFLLTLYRKVWKKTFLGRLLIQIFTFFIIIIQHFIVLFSQLLNFTVLILWAKTSTLKLFYRLSFSFSSFFLLAKASILKLLGRLGLIFILFLSKATVL